MGYFAENLHLLPTFIIHSMRGRILISHPGFFTVLRAMVLMSLR